MTAPAEASVKRPEEKRRSNGQINWDVIAFVSGGMHRAYDVPGTTRTVRDGAVQVGDRCWSPDVPRPELEGQAVVLFVPVGALSGENKSAIVRMGWGAIEVWQRKPRKTKERDDGPEDA